VKKDVFASTFAHNIFLQKYSMNGQETWTETCRRVTDAVTGQYLPQDLREEILSAMVDRKFIPGGRYLYSAGRQFHQVNNCFLFRAEDSREGWADAMQKATSALMTGGGIGFDYSALRGNGELIRRTGGTSTGPLALMHMVNEAGRYIMQGGSRRSAIWAGLNWSHADVFDFMNIKNHSEEMKALKLKDFNFPLPMEGTNISVSYDTEFFMAIENKKHPKHKLAMEVWLKNCRQAFETAEPGMAFNFCKDSESLRNACTEVVSVI
jgi:ribonucleoside-diphosphate reductase alpha chain